MKAFFMPILMPFFPYFTIVGIMLFLSCMHFDKHSKPFNLDGQKFSQEIIQEVYNEVKFKVPPGSIGIAYSYFPPIDPMFFAKFILKNEDGKDCVIKKLKEIKEFPNFPKNFANNQCKWWKIRTKEIIYSKKGFFNNCYFEAYITKEGKNLVLYLKKFSI